MKLSISRWMEPIKLYMKKVLEYIYIYIYIYTKIGDMLEQKITLEQAKTSQNRVLKPEQKPRV